MPEEIEDDLEFWQEPVRDAEVKQPEHPDTPKSSKSSRSSLFVQSPPRSRFARSPTTRSGNNSTTTQFADQTAMTYQQSLAEIPIKSPPLPPELPRQAVKPPSDSGSSLHYQQSEHVFRPPVSKGVAQVKQSSVTELSGPRRDSQSELTYRQDRRQPQSLLPQLMRQVLPSRGPPSETTGDLTFRQQIPKHGSSAILRDLSPISEQEASPVLHQSDSFNFADMDLGGDEGDHQNGIGGETDPGSSPHRRRAPFKRPHRQQTESPSPQLEKRRNAGVRRRPRAESLPADVGHRDDESDHLTVPGIRDHYEPPVPIVRTIPVEDVESADYELDGPTINVSFPDVDSVSEDDWSENDSVKEMIVADTDSSDGEQSVESPSAFSDSDSEVNAELSSDDGEYRPDDDTLADLAGRSSTRRERPTRTRVPALDWWKGEQIIYDYDSKGVATATDVVEVEVPEPQKRPYHRRRRNGTRSSVPHPRQYEITEIPPQEEWRAPIYTGPGNTLHEEILARPLTDFEFEPYPGNELVEVAGLFDPPPGIPVELLVMRIKGGGEVNYALLRERAFTFIVWAGRLRINVNTETYVLKRGMACRVPRGNELTLQNTDADLAVELIITEIGRDEPEQFSVSVSSILP